jgi:prepilin-type N-terminal cleavage/methylation domain-containing protein
MKIINHKGFTLIEILVSLTIIAIIGVVIVQTFLTTVRANTKAEVMREIKQNGDIAMSVITKRILAANTVITPIGTSDSLTITDSEGVNEYTYQAEEIDGLCRISEITGVDHVAMISKSVTVHNCDMDFVVNDNGDGVANRITVSFRLLQANSSEDVIDKATMRFQTTTVMRNVE